MTLAYSLSVSIVTYGVVIETFRNLLFSLEQAIRQAEEAGLLDRSQLYLIDNLGEGAVLQSLLDQTNLLSSYIGTKQNLGYGRAHNLAIKKIYSHYHLILNPDVVLHEDALIEGLKFLETRLDVALIGPQGFTPDGKDAHLCKTYPKISDLLLRGFAPHYVRRRFDSQLARYERHDLNIEQPTDGIELLSGCCLLARSALLKAAGGFDERYFLYFEDFDLSMRMQQKQKLANVPAMKIVHQGGGAARKGLLHIWYFLCSGLRFFTRYGFCRKPESVHKPQ